MTHVMATQELTVVLIAQVGSHGAGLINHMFMRKGTSFLEIVPCGFDDPFHDDSFQVPARVQNFQFGFKLTTVSPMLCSRSQAELGDPEGKGYFSAADNPFVRWFS